MTSLADFVFDESFKVVQSDPVFMAIIIIIISGTALFMARIPFSAIILFYLVLMDGLVGFDYTFGGSTVGSFIDPLFFSFMIFGYLAAFLIIGSAMLRTASKFV